MPATPTTRLQIPLPAQSDPADIPTDLGKLANALDPITAVFGQGAGLSTRPAAGVQGRIYAHQPGRASSPVLGGRALSYDDGTAWTYQAGVPLLTIGGGANQPATALPKNGDCDVGQLLDVLAPDLSGGGFSVPQNGALWRFRFDGTVWRFIGGPPMTARAGQQTATSFPADGAFKNLPNGPFLVVPLDGTYISRGFGACQIGATQSTLTGISWQLAQSSSAGTVVATVSIGSTNFASGSLTGNVSSSTRVAYTNSQRVGLGIVVTSNQATNLTIITSALELLPVSLAGNP